MWCKNGATSTALLIEGKKIIAVGEDALAMGADKKIDLQGKLIKFVSNKNNNIDVQDLQNGMYFLKITSCYKYHLYD